MDWECSTMSWLDCETQVSARKKVVSKLRCSACCKFKERIATRRNFSTRWIEGADLVRTSSIRDQARADQCVHAMMLYKREYAKADKAGACCSYDTSPIATALNKLPDLERSQLHVKFDLAYFIARERMFFRVYPKLCELETRHGVMVGTTYTNEVAGRTFIHYIKEVRRQELLETLARGPFFSFLLDESTDSGNVDNEILMVVYCDTSGDDEKVHTKTVYFQVFQPLSLAGTGLFESVKDALLGLGITEFSAEHCTKLIGIGTDGASANIAKEGLKGLVEQKLQWRTD